MILRKGRYDIVSQAGISLCVSNVGGEKRCAGQGDLLSGIVASFSQNTPHNCQGTENIDGLDVDSQVTAALSASHLTRHASRRTQFSHGFTTTASMILKNLKEVLEKRYG